MPKDTLLNNDYDIFAPLIDNDDDDGADGLEDSDLENEIGNALNQIKNTKPNNDDEFSSTNQPQDPNQNMFSGFSTIPDANLSSEQESFIDNKPQSGYQCPIKGSWDNLGDFSPGVATDARHPSGHQGLDLQAPKGTAIYPLAPGVVTKTGVYPKSGNFVNIKHDNEVKTFYAHCDSVKVKAGDKVDYNTVIATVGTTGNAQGTTPHLHFQVWKNNQLKNPSDFFSVPKYSPQKIKRSQTLKVNKILKLANYYYKMSI